MPVQQMDTVYLWIKFNIIPPNSKMFSKMTIESFKSVLEESLGLSYTDVFL